MDDSPAPAPAPANANATATDRTLDRAVAVTVVLLSSFLALTHIKDDNLVQSMQLAKTEAVDTWSEYQATRTKLHLVEIAQLEIAATAGVPVANPSVVALARLEAERAHYGAEAPRLRAAAQADDARYDALNRHDDQFDLCDALVSIALSLAAVAALADTRWLLGTAWIAGAAGLSMGVAGFAGWSIHPDALAALLS